MFGKFADWHKNRHQYAKEWKAKTGGKVVGYFCSYVPEEILYAAGVLPVRIIGSHEPQDVTQNYIYGMFCPFCRDCLAQGLKGRYDYLDGVMIAQSCIHMRQAFGSWQLHVPVSFDYYIPHPMNVQSPHAKPYLASELKKFRTAVEKWLGKPISDKALDDAIEVYNTNRRLMKEVYEYRKLDKPLLTGLEAMQMTLSGLFTDKKEHNQELTKLLKGLPKRKLNREPGIRLMIVGSEDDDTDFIGMVESLGSTLVIEDHCTGTRYFWEEVKPNKNAITALANRYVDRTPCPSKDWVERRRFTRIMEFVKDFKVQGALVIQQKFCDPHEADIPPLRWLLEKNGIPTYFLEFDITVPLGQFRTRVEAFLETLREEELYV